MPELAVTNKLPHRQKKRPKSDALRAAPSPSGFQEAKRCKEKTQRILSAPPSSEDFELLPDASACSRSLHLHKQLSQ